MTARKYTPPRRLPLAPVGAGITRPLDRRRVLRNAAPSDEGAVAASAVTGGEIHHPASLHTGDQWSPLHLPRQTP